MIVIIITITIIINTVVLGVYFKASHLHIYRTLHLTAQNKYCFWSAFSSPEFFAT